jgi:hypothetical protein
VLRQGLAVSTLLVLVASIQVASLASQAASRAQPPRHVDPAALPTEVEAPAVFQWYLVAAREYLARRYREGRMTVPKLDLANLPPEIRAIVRDLNDTLTKEGVILEAAEQWLREASALIGAGQVDAARQVLRRLEEYVRRGAILVDDSLEGFRDLARRVNIEALPSEAPQRQAYEELLRTAARAKALLLAYRAVSGSPQQAVAFARLLPYRTTIELAAPSTVYPGRPFPVSGRVVEQAPKPSKGRVLTLAFDGRTLAELPVGRFHKEVVLPPGTLPGTHVLTATVPPSGRYLGATAERRIEIALAVPYLEVRWPKAALAPGRISVSGTARSKFGPVGGAVVRAWIGRAQAEARTSRAGEFRIELALPASVNLVGPQEVTLTVVPVEPWHAPAELGLGLFVINLVNAGLLALLLPVAGVALVRSARRTPSARQVDSNREAYRESIAETRMEAGGRAIPGTPAGQLLSIYLDALRRVQAATGIPMGPSTTLREFAQQTRRTVRGDAFLQMTELAELALYSARPITGDLVDLARRLMIRLEGELPGVVP